jgi:hypothetical protein
MTKPDSAAATEDFAGLRAMFINCTLNRSPEPSHTQGLVDKSAAIMAPSTAWRWSRSGRSITTSLSGCART